MINELDSIIQLSLTEMCEFIKGNKWIGREGEVISLYVLGLLQHKFKTGTCFNDPTQIGIEVAVKQIDKDGKKKVNKDKVNKDLVIWKKPRETCFDNDMKPVKSPISIMEWKVRHHDEKYIRKKIKDHQKDIDWLIRFSKGKQDFVGYAAYFDLYNSNVSLKVCKIENNSKKEDWFVYPDAL
ncbi:MAG: hypothetical protein P9L94_15330 [Candidatus Hinthialibacter antarcticus]|nr:hypothetical protein [Candidatus Hinthialibacter antarcticus]